MSGYHQHVKKTNCGEEILQQIGISRRDVSVTLDFGKENLKNNTNLFKLWVVHEKKERENIIAFFSLLFTTSSFSKTEIALNRCGRSRLCRISKEAA